MSSTEVIRAFRAEYQKTPTRVKVCTSKLVGCAHVLDAFLVYALATAAVQEFGDKLVCCDHCCIYLFAVRCAFAHLLSNRCMISHLISTSSSRDGNLAAPLLLYSVSSISQEFFMHVAALAIIQPEISENNPQS
eukprot:scaffold167858_cov19-Tisochrysis_lutea.AAC.1